MRRYVEFVDQIHLPFPPRMRATSKGERVSRALQVCVAPAARVKFSDGNHQQRRREEPQSPQVKMNPTLYNMPRAYSTLATKKRETVARGEMWRFYRPFRILQRRNIPSAKRDGRGNDGIPREVATEPRLTKAKVAAGGRCAEPEIFCGACRNTCGFRAK